MHLNFFLKSGFSFRFSEFSALLPTPGASNCSLKTVVWILIGYKSRPYLGLVVTETVLKPTATSPPSGSLGELVGVGDGFKAPVVSPTFCYFSGPTFVGERGTGEAGESRVDRSSLNSLGEEDRRSLEYATGILIFPPWVCTRPLSQRSSQRPGIRPPPLTCPVLPAWTLGCPGSARTSSPEENLSGPGLRSRAAEAERTARRSDRLEAEFPLPPCRGLGGGGPGLKHAPPPILALPEPRGDAPGSGSPKQSARLAKCLQSPRGFPRPRMFAAAAARASRAPRPAPRAEPPPVPWATRVTRPLGPAPPLRSRRALQPRASAPLPSPRLPLGPPGTYLRWGCSGGHPEPGGGGGGGAGRRGQHGAPSTAAAGRLVLPSRGPAQRYK